MDPEETGSNNTVEGQEPVETNSQETTEETTESGYNPNWKELMDDLPDDFIRNRVRPHLEKFDKNNNSRFEKVQQQYDSYKAYEPLVKNQIPFEEVQKAFQLRQRLTESPQEVFNYLAQHLGYDISKLNANTEGQGLDNQQDQEDNEPLDPRIIEMQKRQQDFERQQEALTNYAAQQWHREQEIQRQQQEQTWYNEVKTGLDTLGITDKSERNYAVQFGLMHSQQTGKPFDLKEGVRIMREFQGQAIANSASRQAPNVVAGTGSYAAERPNLNSMDAANEYAVQLMQKKRGQ